MSTDRSHNAPESGGLSLEELASVDAARGAYMALKKTFDHWITIGRGLQTLRIKADRMGGRKTFDRLREQQELGNIPKATVTRLLHIIEQLPDVERWRQTLTQNQQFDWASPSAVFKHCPVFKVGKPVAKPKPTKAQQLEQEVIRLEQENHSLKQREDGDRFKPTDTALDIATVLVGMFSPSKAEMIAKKVLQLIKVHSAAAKEKSRSSHSSQPAP